MKGWEPDARRLGARVRALRQARKWSQWQLAEYAELSRQCISNVERGQSNVTISTMKRLAQSLECEIPDLFFAALA